jgi:hypothetical protein
MTDRSGTSPPSVAARVVLVAYLNDDFMPRRVGSSACSDAMAMRTADR